MSASGEIQAALESRGRFSILSEISEGANAFSFRAHDPLLQRDVFLKVIYYSDEVATDLLQEPRVLVRATQSSPPPENLVQVFGAELLEVERERFLCLQMECVNGSSLSAVLATEAFGQLDAVKIAIGILHGLSRLHYCRILHRDLKPANIVLAGATPKIADFGSAAVLPEGTTQVPRSRHSALYVPPEGWGDNPYFCIASDIYQVGMILYEIVNGPLEYSLRHYLTPRVLRELQAQGCDQNSLDDYETSCAANRGIAQLCGSGNLLMHGRPPRPYYSPKLRRVIAEATNPTPERRFENTADFIAKLNQLDIPNWKVISETELVASNWRGWDWKVHLNGHGVSISRARRGTEGYRRIRGVVVSSLREAISYVENR